MFLMFENFREKVDNSDCIVTMKFANFFQAFSKNVPFALKNNKIPQWKRKKFVEKCVKKKSLIELKKQK
ncbi:hypothetical protein RFI_30485 [Reticulomyxa filosa]|uniref:Uncharacterized protein n=1 Tax=Reticulomyxa filosa TaxID=46433 RepID=X6M1S4_RETFI|nr:hypothetical protein RFI_30485 [Reticulomyxa filosa]|eukprot:ETO06910.1 hypothetical protein RFI_30485 [Reticulomyxa filosa]